MIYLDRLNYYLELIAAKRTPEEEAKDLADIKRRLKEKEAKDAAKRAEKGQKPLEYTKEGKTSTKPKDIKDIIAKLKEVRDPQLLIINSNITSVTPKGDVISDEHKKENRKKYFSFIKEPSVKDALNSSVNLLSSEGVHIWICDLSHLKNLKDTAFAYDLVEESSGLPKDFLKQKNPFEKVKIALNDDKNAASKVKADLLVKWEPIYTNLNPEAKEEKEDKTEEDKIEKEVEDEKTIEEKDSASEDEKDTDTKDTDLLDDEESDKGELDLDIDEAPHLKVGKFRSLKDPYIFILDPRKKSSEYQTFLDKEDPKSSKILPKALKLLNSKKLKSEEGYPVIVYFLNQRNALELNKELEKEIKPHYFFGKFNKDLFDSDDPFTGLKIGDRAIDQSLIDELNKAWTDATSEASGNPMPAVQASANIPIGFFRFLNKKQRPIEMYIGGRPEGAGSEGTVYVLASEQEANAFVRTVRRFKMSSLFYERLSSNSDIDPEFKDQKPDVLTPTNALILIGDFNPKENVKITDANIEIASIYPEIKAKYETAKKEKKEISASLSQLELLHAFAKVKLGNKTQNPGAFLKHKGLIGTHIAQFNADMSICFLWGSHTKHVTLDRKVVVNQLPFVKTAITGYL